MRTFLALPLAGLFRVEISGVLEALKGKRTDIKWVPPDHVHITLHFFGSVDPEQIPEISGIVRFKAGRFSPFEIGLEGMGCFPNEARPQVVWLGVRGGTRELAEVQHAIEAKLRRAGFPCEDRSFKPHATIGRLRKGQGRVPPFEALKFVPTPLKKVQSLILFKSRLTPAGSFYEPIETFPLGLPA